MGGSRDVRGWSETPGTSPDIRGLDRVLLRGDTAGGTVQTAPGASTTSTTSAGTSMYCPRSYRSTHGRGTTTWRTRFHPRFGPVYPSPSDTRRRTSTRRTRFHPWPGPPNPLRYGTRDDDVEDPVEDPVPPTVPVRSSVRTTGSRRGWWTNRRLVTSQVR